MQKFKFKKIDAFAAKNSAGNPAGYISLNSFAEITETQMLQIAKELKGFVNEVGYVAPTSPDSFELKFYSSERQVDLCGHATIAIMYDLLKTTPELQKFDVLKIKTNCGVLNVENRIKTQDAVFVMAPSPVYTQKIPATADIAQNLKISQTAINTTLPISIINAGLTTLIVPINTLSQTLAITPDLEQLKSFCVSNNIDIIALFTPEVANPANNLRTRVFAPTFGYLEDPATGSGNSAIGYYLIQNNLWQTETITIEQNSTLTTPNIIKLQQTSNLPNTPKILFGGAAITRIEGEYFLW